MGKESARKSCRKIKGEHMLKVVNLKLSDINELVRLTADKKKLPPSMVENDFWEKIVILHKEAHEEMEKRLIGIQGTIMMYIK